MTESSHETSATEEVPQAEQKPAAKRRLPSFGSGNGGSHDMTATINSVRSLAAKVIWIVCVVFALLLALEVLLIALKANPDNGLVKFDVKFTPHIDLHWFNLMNPIKDFDKKKPVSTDVKTALFNYGLAAIVWLIIGRIADAILKPSARVKSKG